MNPNRRAGREPVSNDEPDRKFTSDPRRASTLDSGRGSMVTTDRASTLDRATTSSTSSYLSTGTPTTVAESDEQYRDEPDEEEPIVIPRHRHFVDRCYEQAFVSHIDHPSAFFLQLDGSVNDIKQMHKNINEFYSKTPLNQHRAWQPGEYCIAQYNDNQFYRARIIDASEAYTESAEYDIVFVDYGNWCKVPRTRIHRILPLFARLPAQAIACSLNRTLPPNGTWSAHPEAVALFRTLAAEKYVDATFRPKSKTDYWPLSFVELSLSKSKVSIHDTLKASGLIREAKNDEIYYVFQPLMGPVDHLIYNIPSGNDDYDN